MITGGSQSFRRVVNLGDYNSKEAKAEIHFTLEGDNRGLDIVVQEAMKLAVTSVATQLATVVKLDEMPVPTGVVDEVTFVVEEVAPPAAPSRRGRRTQEPVKNKEPEETDETSPAVSDDFEPIMEISDRELQTACEKKNLVLKDAIKIRRLIAEFSNESMAKIPQVRRVEFLTKLDALS